MKEILTKDEKEVFESYINFMLQNGFKKEEFEFTKMPNPNPYVLRVKAESFIKNMKVENCALERMVLGKTYTWKELGLYDVNKGILDDKEREYLSVVIKPFRDEVEFIMKDYTDDDKQEYIEIAIKDEVSILFPYFKKSTMYAGMERCKKYTLEELGLWHIKNSN